MRYRVSSLGPLFTTNFAFVVNGRLLIGGGLRPESCGRETKYCEKDSAGDKR